MRNLFREKKKKPSVCLVGPIMGQNPGWVTSPGNTLADVLRNAGYEVKITSAVKNRYLRVIDAVKSIILWHRKIDIFVLYFFAGPAVVAGDIESLIIKKLHSPLVIALHGGALPYFTDRHDKWIKRILSRADLIIAPSGYLSDYFCKIGFNVTVVPNIIQLEKYRYQNRKVIEPKLLWMRTFEDIYNPQVAIEVLEKLRKTYPRATLTMAGQDWGLLSSMKDLARRKGLESCINFVGFLDMEGKEREFASHDIYLHTNSVDNMPVSVLEAAAFGLPIVATRAGGISYLLKDGENALFVEIGNIQDMVNSIRRLIEEPGLAARLSENGRRLAESCGWESVRPKWEEVFRVVLNSRQGIS